MIPINLHIYVIGIVAVSLITIIDLVTSIDEQSINAQMMMGHNGGFGNMTSDQTINGSINHQQIILEGINSKANTTLAQAVTTAEQSVGNNSFAFSAFAGGNQSFILLSTPEMKFYDVTVNLGNGQILTSQETSKEEMEKMHLKHSMEVVDNSNVSDRNQMIMGESCNNKYTPDLLDFAKSNTTLAQAVTTAEQSVGNNSFAFVAVGADQGSGSLMYRILLSTPEMEYYNVMVDPRNGQILSSEQIAQKDIQELHLKHSMEVVDSGSNGTDRGVPFLH